MWRGGKGPLGAGGDLGGPEGVCGTGACLGARTVLGPDGGARGGAHPLGPGVSPVRSRLAPLLRPLRRFATAAETQLRTRLAA